MQAVILTGRVLPDRDPDRAWIAAGKLFKLEPDAFKARVLARCPLTIRETDDSAELERIRAGLKGCGAEVKVVESDGSKWNLLHDGRMCGPVSLAYLKLEHEAGHLSDSVQVKQLTDTEWVSLGHALEHPASEIVLDVPAELQAETDELPPPLPSRKAGPDGMPQAPAGVASSPERVTPTQNQNILSAHLNNPVILASLSPVQKIGLWLLIAVCTVLPIWIFAVLNGTLPNPIAGDSSSHSWLGSNRKSGNQNTIEPCDSNQAVRTFLEMNARFFGTVYKVSDVQEQLYDEQRQLRYCSMKVTLCNKTMHEKYGDYGSTCPEERYELYRLYFSGEVDRSKNVFTIHGASDSDLGLYRMFLKDRSKFTLDADGSPAFKNAPERNVSSSADIAGQKLTNPSGNTSAAPVQSAAASPTASIAPVLLATTEVDKGSSATDHCEADAPSAQAPEETTLLANGHRYLTGKRLRAGAHGEFFVVEAALGYDGQCRPGPYQIYVFNQGKQVGTLSPNAMHARSDGAITGFKLLDADHLQFEVDHFKPSDPACCASSHEEKIVPLSQFASPQTGNAQDNLYALAQSSQTTNQGIAILEQSSQRLLWTQEDSRKEVNWIEAQSFCSAQGEGWRLPSTNEVGAIFDQSGTMTTSCGTFTCRVSPLFRLTAGGYWTNVEVGQSGARVFVLDGGTTYQGQKDGRGNVRALCVKPMTTSDTAATPPAQTPMATGIPPSFDCRRATTITENAICASSELSSLDGQLGQVFSDVIATASPDQTKNVRAEQLAWIKARNDECQGGASCLGTSLRKRIAELTAFKAEHPSIPMAQERPQNAPATASPTTIAHVNSSPTKPNANSATSENSECESYAKNIARLRASGSAIDSHVADRLEFARNLQGCK